MLFFEGIIYNQEMFYYRTSRVNSLFSAIPQLAVVLKGDKNGDSIKIDKIPAWVTLPVQNSNHFIAELKLLADVRTM